MLLPKKSVCAKEQSTSQPERANDTHAVIGAVLLAGFCLAVSLYMAGHRVLWYDEIFTAVVSGRQWPGETLRILKTGADQQPLTYYLLVKLSGALFGPGAFSLRLPSALAMFVGLLVSFDCARRLTDGLHGLLAPSLLICSVLPFYGFEARPYALVFMWSACSLWLWIHTLPGSKPAALAFGLAVFGSVAAHYYAVFCLVPYGVSVLLEIRQKGLPPKMIAGCAGAAAGLALILPVAGALRGLRNGFWSPASFGTLDSVFVYMFPHAFVFLALILIWIAVTASHESREVVRVLPMEDSERLAWMFLLIPFAGFIVGRLLTNAVVYRYFIDMLPGVAVGFSCLMWRRLRHRTIVAAGILGILAGGGVLLYIGRLRHLELMGAPVAKEQIVKAEKLLDSEETLLREGKQFVVLPAESLLSIEAAYLSRHPDRYRVLDDPRLPLHLNTGPNKALSRYLPIHFWNLNDLKEHAPETVLVDPSGDVVKSTERLGLDTYVVPDDLLTIMYLK